MKNNKEKIENLKFNLKCWQRVADKMCTEKNKLKQELNEKNEIYEKLKLKDNSY